MSTKLAFVSLGCPKNEVDAERMIKKLVDAGYETVEATYEADVVIINTCAFIDAAKQEAIDAILAAADLKQDGQVKKVIVTGCLAERFREDVIKEMPEVDAVIGIGSNGDIVELVNRALAGETVTSFGDKKALPPDGDRALTTPPYTAYLKIADGCSNACSYCIIPKIRGAYRSRKIEDVLEEAHQLADAGVKELILIAQDTTRYGYDLYGEDKLPELLEELVKIDGFRWIRMLYCYPERMSDRLLDVMAKHDRILNYIDLPLQHADEGILKAMRRGSNKQELLTLLAHIREKLPGCVIRTTLIAGFPGESEDAFGTLCDFVKEARFERLGCFAYSAEEGTPAALMDSQLDEDEKQSRAETVMEIQYGIFEEKQEELIGTVVECVVEGYDGYTDSYYGRTWMDAPEIDSAVYFTGLGDYDPGDFVNVKILDVRDFDLYGQIV